MQGHVVQIGRRLCESATSGSEICQSTMFAVRPLSNPAALAASRQMALKSLRRKRTSTRQNFLPGLALGDTTHASYTPSLHCSLLLCVDLTGRLPMVAVQGSGS